MDNTIRIPKKVICEFHGGVDCEVDKDGHGICEIDAHGWCRCGDAIQEPDGTRCCWIREILEWQEIAREDLLG